MKDDWRLHKLELEFKDWGEDKGKYVGSISFKNGDYVKYAQEQVVRKDISHGSTHLIQRLLQVTTGDGSVGVQILRRKSDETSTSKRVGASIH